MTSTIALLLCIGQAAAGRGTDELQVFTTDLPELRPEVYSQTPEALKNLQFQRLDLPGADAANVRFGQALQELVEGDPAEAARRFEALCDDPDPGVRSHARQLRVELHMDAGEFEQLARKLRRWEVETTPHLRALSRLPTPTVTARPPIGDTLTTQVGLPMVEVDVAGKRRQWVFDTGAEFTLLSETLADDLGARMVDIPLAVATSTTQTLAARFGVLDQLDVGELRFEDLAVLVVPDALLLSKAGGETVDLRAILGWNAIRHAVSTLDRVDRTYTMRLSEPTTTVDERNLFWLDTPVVRGVGPEGQPLAFQLDTGSSTTDVTANFFTKVTPTRVRKRRVSMGGAAGVERRRTRVVDELEFALAGYRFVVPDASEQVEETTFILLDGRLGSDVAAGCRVTLDPPNGRYAMDCPSAKGDTR